MEVVVHATGHEHVSATHASTFEVTSDDWLTPAGDCIVGCESDAVPTDLPREFVAACRDVLRVIRAQPGAESEDLRPILDETEILSGKIDELWHDGWRGYAPFVYENE